MCQVEIQKARVEQHSRLIRKKQERVDVFEGIMAAAIYKHLQSLQYQLGGFSSRSDCAIGRVGLPFAEKLATAHDPPTLFGRESGSLVPQFHHKGKWIGMNEHVKVHNM